MAVLFSQMGEVPDLSAVLHPQLAVLHPHLHHGQLSKLWSCFKLKPLHKERNTFKILLLIRIPWSLKLWNTSVHFMSWCTANKVDKCPTQQPADLLVVLSKFNNCGTLWWLCFSRIGPIGPSFWNILSLKSTLPLEIRSANLKTHLFRFVR